jgi:hypothetical protein
MLNSATKVRLYLLVKCGLGLYVDKDLN